MGIVVVTDLILPTAMNNGSEKTVNFAGKIILVTGAAAGIGAATSQAFLERGGLVIALDVNEVALHELRSHCGDQLIPVICDLSSEASITKAVLEIKARFDRVDVLVNNAGAGRFVGMEFTPADFDQHFHINLRGPMLLIKHCLELLQASASPSVINIASVAARLEWANHFLYSCAKAGLEKYTKHLVRDLPWLRANCILPGVIDTAILDSLATPEEKAGLFQLIQEQVPCGRVGSTEDIAKAILFLASADASYINGASLVVDGGLSHANTWLGL